MFYDVFWELCQEKHVTPTQVSREIGVPQSTIAMWKKQGTTPNAKTVAKLADYFGVTLEHLLTGIVNSKVLDEKKGENKLRKNVFTFELLSSIYDEVAIKQVRLRGKYKGPGYKGEGFDYTLPPDDPKRIVTGSLLYYVVKDEGREFLIDLKTAGAVEDELKKIALEIFEELKYQGTEEEYIYGGQQEFENFMGGGQ